MASELTVRENGFVEMAYTGQTPWHNCGTFGLSVDLKTFSLLQKEVVTSMIWDKWDARAGEDNGTIYRIKRSEVHPNRIRCDVIGEDFTDLNKCNGKIKDFAEAHRKEAKLIQHHAGQSVVFFKNYYVEFTRSPSSQGIPNGVVSWLA